MHESLQKEPNRAVEFAKKIGYDLADLPLIQLAFDHNRANKAYRPIVEEMVGFITDLGIDLHAEDLRTQTPFDPYTQRVNIKTETPPVPGETMVYIYMAKITTREGELITAASVTTKKPRIEGFDDSFLEHMLPRIASAIDLERGTHDDPESLYERLRKLIEVERMIAVFEDVPLEVSEWLGGVVDPQELSRIVDERISARLNNIPQRTIEELAADYGITESRSQRTIREALERIVDKECLDSNGRDRALTMLAALNKKAE